LRRFEGPLHICGAGRDLAGSPFDPSAERRSVQTATRMLASQFPAPGYEGQSAQPDLLFLPMPAYIIGGPVDGGFDRRPVDLIIPVYGGIEIALACLESVLADLPRWARVVVVDDASPDPRMAQELGNFVARHGITVLHQSANPQNSECRDA
jgi:hypothetical protein